MKTLSHVLSLAVFLSALAPQFSTCWAQGPLAPTAAPTPTMKSLDQIEARTPISSAPFMINASGSYYLTKNISVTTATNAIEISVNEVTLDLNGFTISSTASPAGATAILLTNASGNANITIRNGFIRGGVTYSGGTYSGSGFSRGIFYTASAPANIHVTGIGVSGCLSYGIRINDGISNVAEFCTVQSCGNVGIYANTVSHCSAYQCGISAIQAITASDCYGYSTDGGTLRTQPS
jgi:hypothetical protein